MDPFTESIEKTAKELFVQLMSGPVDLFNKRLCEAFDEIFAEYQRIHLTYLALSAANANSGWILRNPHYAAMCGRAYMRHVPIKDSFRIVAGLFLLRAVRGTCMEAAKGYQHAFDLIMARIVRELAERVASKAHGFQLNG